MRIYDEPIHVLVAEQPVQFVWRQRLMLIKRVVTRWVEAGQWWRALDNSDDLLAEREVWRVEAGNGSSVGVYELVRGPGTEWTLRAVLD